MENVLSRREFCEKISKCLINLLNQKYSVNESSDKCLIQRTRHPALKKLGDLHMSKMLVNYLEIKYGAVSDDNTHFNLALCEVLGLLIETSKAWNITVIFWKEHNGGFVFGLDRLKAFQYIIPKILSTDMSEMPPLACESALIFCHVNTNSVLHDLRTLIYCEVLCNFFKGKCKVVLSKDQESCAESLCEELINGLNLKMDLIAPVQIEAYTSTNHSVPMHFADCLRNHEKSYPYLESLHHHGNRTAFASKNTNNYKNSVVHKCKEFMLQNSEGSFRCIHVCNQTNFLMAQQSELFHAWYKDEECETMKEVDIIKHSDHFFTHSGIRNTAQLSTTEFLNKRSEQIQESFESKLQMTTEGDQWKNLFSKMRTGLIKLELLKNSTGSSVKLEDSLPSDAVFVLYNYSRLHMLIEKYSDQGNYPCIPISDVDFNCLREEAEWELVIDHLWMLHDIIQMINPIFQQHSMEINCHHVGINFMTKSITYIDVWLYFQPIDYLHQLCRCVSTYYSRYHILVEALPHLIPTVTSRMFLIKAVKKAMDRVFQLFGVDPILQM